jgi:predicted TIM-barrel fold metal-dependent hydrolase
VNDRITKVTIRKARQPLCQLRRRIAALRMILGGVFDRPPGLKVILGHLGEGIPFHLPRIDDTLTPLAGHLAKPVSGYFREHFWITTSGYFYDGPFRLTREMLGDDRADLLSGLPVLRQPAGPRLVRPPRPRARRAGEDRARHRR